MECRFGLYIESTGHWWVDHAKGTALGLVIGVATVLALWGLLRWLPDYWWLAAAAGASVVLAVFTQLTPILLFPIFYDCRQPLLRPELAERLVALAERAGTRVLDVFELRLGDRTRKANAALTGLGRTRRILVSDTLLAEHSDDEVEVIVTHELGHHVYHDIWRGIAIEAVLLGLWFYLTDRVLAALVAPLGLAGKDDIAVLPLLLLSVGVVSLMVLPVSNAVSRWRERRADRYALTITRNPEAFISAMRRLGDWNLSEPHPSRLVQTLFYTHPPVAVRIDAAQRWARPRPNGSSASVSLLEGP